MKLRNEVFISECLHIQESIPLAVNDLKTTQSLPFHSLTIIASLKESLEHGLSLYILVASSLYYRTIGFPRLMSLFSQASM